MGVSDRNFRPGELVKVHTAQFPDEYRFLDVAHGPNEHGEYVGQDENTGYVVFHHDDAELVP